MDRSEITIERLRQIALDIEQSPHQYPEDFNNLTVEERETISEMPFDQIGGFNMSDFHTYTAETECHTVGCVAGFVMRRYAPSAAITNHRTGEPTSITTLASRELGISQQEGYGLFHVADLDQPLVTDLDEIEPANAAEVLRLMADGAHAVSAWQQVLEEIGSRQDD